jgi:hypothetical protein
VVRGPPPRHHPFHRRQPAEGELKIITANLERPAIEKILTHLGASADLDSPEDCPSQGAPQPPPKTPARELVPNYAG